MFIIIIIVNDVSFNLESEKNIRINKEFDIEKTSCEILNVVGDKANPDNIKQIYVLVRGVKNAYQAKPVILNYLDTATLYPYKYYIISFYRYEEGMKLDNLLYNTGDNDLTEYLVSYVDFTDNMFTISVNHNTEKKQSCTISIDEFTRGNRQKLILERLKYIN